MFVTRNGAATAAVTPHASNPAPQATTQELSAKAPSADAAKPAFVAPSPRPVAAAAALRVEPTEWVSPRLTHLNVQPRWRASAMYVEDTALLRDLEGISELWVGKLRGNEDAIFVGGTVDAAGWKKLRASIKPTGVVWRIYPNRSVPSANASSATPEGFVRGTRVRYSPDYVADQFMPRGAASLVTRAR
jgi:hypothetical protein